MLDGQTSIIIHLVSTPAAMKRKNFPTSTRKQTRLREKTLEPCSLLLPCETIRRCQRNCPLGISAGKRHGTSWPKALMSVSQAATAHFQPTIFRPMALQDQSLEVPSTVWTFPNEPLRNNCLVHPAVGLHALGPSIDFQPPTLDNALTKHAPNPSRQPPPSGTAQRREKSTFASPQ